MFPLILYKAAFTPNESRRVKSKQVIMRHESPPQFNINLNVYLKKPFTPEESRQVKSLRVASRQVKDRAGPIFYISHSESVVVGA